MSKAVIDVGSNSVLLVVGEQTANDFNVIHEASRVTGLGAGVKATGVLSDKGMDETLAAVRDFFRIAKEHGSSETVAKATMAARIAANRSDFLDQAAAQGTPVKVLSGEEEAGLGFRSVAEDTAFRDRDPLTIIDPGGNSTELVLANQAQGNWDFRFRKSFPIGTLALRDGALANESPDSEALLKAVREIDDTIGSYEFGEPGTAVVLGATGTNLVSVKKQLTSWDPVEVHGERLEYEEVGRAVGWLSAMSDAERAGLIGMEKGRERTIHIGALILERFLHAIHAPQVVVSVRGWRHALLSSLFSR